MASEGRAFRRNPSSVGLRPTPSPATGEGERGLAIDIGGGGEETSRRKKTRKPLMSDAKLQTLIEQAFEDRAAIGPQTTGDVRDAVERALTLLDSGKARVAEKILGATGPGSWKVNQWLKKAVLLSFRLNDNAIVPGGPGGAVWWDKVPSKFAGWDEAAFRAAGFRAVPGCIVRRSAYIAPDAVLMPCFLNLGAYVDAKTMVDTWVTVGSCAQIGKNVHLSGGVGIGGVLEPLQANPTIIEDDCFIGARSEVVEGVIVGEGSVVSMGVFISASTKVVDRATGKIHVGYVPPYSVVVSGSLPGKPLPDGSPGPSLYCAVIVKTVDAKTRAKTGINELLRD
jgi:2,3,4,5-tetrahydropyridine-2-carboxylate N-succinyltransferase